MKKTNINKQIVILIGAPGSGKGTQADLLIEKCNLYKLSTGDLLREEISKKNKLSDEIQNCLSTGQLVSDEIILNLVKNKIEKTTTANGYIFDGFPRTSNQCKLLDNILTGFADVNLNIYPIYLKLTKDDVINRISGRIQCRKCNQVFHEITNPPSQNNLCIKNGPCDFFKRDDDNEEVLSKRFDIFNKEIKEILDFYEDLIEIDANNDIKNINDSLCELILE